MSLLNEGDIWAAFGKFRRKAGKRNRYSPEFYAAWLIVAGNRGLYGGKDDVGRERARAMYRKHVKQNPIDVYDMKQTMEIVESIYDE